MARITKRGTGSRGLGPRCDWLKELDTKVKCLPGGSTWLEDSELAPQRCRRFIMARFPELLRPFSDEVLSRELSRGEKKIRDSAVAYRILRGLDARQRNQLAGLLQDVIESLEAHTHYGPSSKMVHDLALVAECRMRMLSRKVVKVRSEMEALRDYAKRLHRSLGLDYVHAAESCLKTLRTLELKNYGSDAEFYRSLKSEYPPLQDPKQLGMVQLYWFFRSECQCSGREAEVRVAMIANAFLALRAEVQTRVQRR